MITTMLNLIAVQTAGPLTYIVTPEGNVIMRDELVANVL